jgi:hypothetical protein
MLIDSHCARCLAPAPNVDDPAFTKWEALDDEGFFVVCSTCITPEEQQAIDEAPTDLDDAW